MLLAAGDDDPDFHAAGGASGGGTGSGRRVRKAAAAASYADDDLTEQEVGVQQMPQGPPRAARPLTLPSTHHPLPPHQFMDLAEKTDGDPRRLAAAIEVRSGGRRSGARRLPSHSTASPC